MGQYMHLKYLVLLLAIGLSACSQSPISTETTDKQLAVTAFGRDAVEASDTQFINEGLHDADTSDDSFLKMVRDLGGFDKFNDFMQESSKKKIENLHKKYGLGFSTKRPDGYETLGTLNVRDCVVRFPASDRSRSFTFDKQTLFIDSVGRPRYNSFTHSGISGNRAPAARQPTCQRDTGKLGIANDEGGHLVASVLGGWGGRANLVPQNANFNRGSWRLIEDATAGCLNNFNLNSHTYQAAVTYPNSATLRPNNMVVYLSVKELSIPTFRAGETVFRGRITFPNAPGGGPNGRQAVAAFRSLLFREVPYCRQ